MVDNINLYQTYRAPAPEAPYPQDYIIDQNGIVRYWSDEYDPQEIIKTIDQLLITDIKESKTQFKKEELRLNIKANPVRKEFTISSPLLKYPDARLKFYNSMGKLLNEAKPRKSEEITISIQEKGVIFVILIAEDKIIRQKVTIVDSK